MKTIHLSIITGTTIVILVTIGVFVFFNQSPQIQTGVQDIHRDENNPSQENSTAINRLVIKDLNNTYKAGYPVTATLHFVTQNPDCQEPSVLVTNLSTNMPVYGPTLLWNYTNAQCSNSTQISFYAGLEKNQLITDTERYKIMATLYVKQYQREFTVVPSEYSGKNITAESTLLPGSDPWLSCPAISGSLTSETVVGTRGFDGVYHRYLTNYYPNNEVEDYFLKPGHSGSITLKVHPGSAFPIGENLATGELILNKNSHYGNFAHPGVSTSYNPSIAIAGLDGSATFSLVVSTTQNATHGTYWIYLPPGGCSGGQLSLLTIGDRPMAQPPDLIGYDPPVDFSFSESPILTANIFNFGIHTFDNCSLTFTNNNKTLLIKNFDEIRPGFVYKHHFDSNPLKGDKVTFECGTPHMVKTFSPDQ